VPFPYADQPAQIIEQSLNPVFNLRSHLGVLSCTKKTAILKKTIAILFDIKDGIYTRLSRILSSGWEMNLLIQESVSLLPLTG
jgi:hypothetical protein